MGKPIRRLIAAASAAVTIGTGAAVWATSSASAAPAAPAASTPRCTAADLEVWLGKGGVALGTAHIALEFTNVSDRACHLSGYPAVSALTKLDKQLGNAARRDSRVKVTTVTIAAGGTAHADLGWTDALLFPASKCKPTTAMYVSARPPGAKHSDSGFAPIPACSVKGETYLSVTAVGPGPNNN